VTAGVVCEQSVAMQFIQFANTVAERCFIKRTRRQFAICQCPFVINAENDRHARLSSTLQRMDCFMVGLLMKCAHVCCLCSSGLLPNPPLSFSSTVTGTFVLPHGHAVVVDIDCMVMAL